MFEDSLYNVVLIYCSFPKQDNFFLLKDWALVIVFSHVMGYSGTFLVFYKMQYSTVIHENGVVQFCLYVTWLY